MLLSDVKCVLIHDNFQNYKGYSIPRAQLVIADIPYNIPIMTMPPLTIELLDEVKESIINAYEEKSGLSRSKIARMMDVETWLNAKTAQSLGLVDGILFAGSAPFPVK